MSLFGAEIRLGDIKALRQSGQTLKMQLVCQSFNWIMCSYWEEQVSLLECKFRRRCDSTVSRNLYSLLLKRQSGLEEKLGFPLHLHRNKITEEGLFRPLFPPKKIVFVV